MNHFYDRIDNMIKGQKIVEKIFPNFEFDLFSNEAEIDDSIKLEYIKEMIAYAKSDKQAMFMYLTFGLAASIFTIDKFDSLIRRTGSVYLVLFYIGIVLLIISVVSFFFYWRRVHDFQQKMISCIPRLNIEKTRDLWVRLWRENKKFFFFGLSSLIAGSLLVCITILVVKFIS